MKIAAIVCEYNPMHNGHAYHIAQTRKAGATHVVAVMSGNFVQRGECALFDKWTRADIAAHCGADLVVELPTVWSCDSAQNFAFGAVSIANSLKADVLSFGSEIDDVQKLSLCAELCEKEEVIARTKQNMKSGMSYPLALSASIKAFSSSEIGEVFSFANATLAVEYIKAINKLSSPMKPMCIKRKGSEHDNDSLSGEFVSASAIRNAKDILSCRSLMPEYAFSKLSQSNFEKAQMKNAEKAVLSHLRRISKNELEKYIEDENGLCDRIYSSSKTSCTLEELYQSVKTKNITMAKVRRSVLRTFLQIPFEFSKEKPPYVKVLAANKKGLEILKKAKDTAFIATKHSDFQKLDDFSRDIYESECLATDLYSLFFEKTRACSFEQTSSANIIK